MADRLRRLRGADRPCSKPPGERGCHDRKQKEMSEGKQSSAEHVQQCKRGWLGEQKELAASGGGGGLDQAVGV